MIYSKLIEGVYLSTVVNLKDRFEESFRFANHFLRFRNPEEISDPSKIRFALAWEPENDAFAKYPNIEMVSSIGAGVDNIIRCSSLSNDTIVTRVCDHNQAHEIAEFAVWQVIWYHRNMRQYFTNESNHKWHWVDRIPVRDCMVGILGYGFMGQSVAKALVALGFPVIAACRTVRNNCDNFDVILMSGPNSIRNTAERSNILINLLPLTTETHHILDADLFRVMPKASVLIQMGRGEHLVEKDLIEALDNGKLSAATIDVFCKEPLPPEHQYWDDPRIMVTPHDASESSISAVAQQVTSCVYDLARGIVPRFAIDRRNGY